MPLIEYLFYRPGPAGEVFAQWGMALFGAYAALILAFVVLGPVLRTLNQRHALKSRVTRQMLGYGLMLQMVGLLTLALRYLNWPVVSMRIFLYAHLVALVVAAGYLWWWMRNRYPVLLTEYEWEERKRSYLPRPAGGNAPPPRRKAAQQRRK